MYVLSPNITKSIPLRIMNSSMQGIYAMPAEFKIELVVIDSRWIFNKTHNMPASSIQDVNIDININTDDLSGKIKATLLDPHNNVISEAYNDIVISSAKYKIMQRLMSEEGYSYDEAVEAVTMNYGVKFTLGDKIKLIYSPLATIWIIVEMDFDKITRGSRGSYRMKSANQNGVYAYESFVYADEVYEKVV